MPPMNVQVTVPFGKMEMSFAVDERHLGSVLTPEPSRPLGDVPSALENELRQPFCRAFLETVEKSRKEAGRLTVAVVINDYTRFSPMREVLPFLLNRLNRAGVEDSEIRIIPALGTHRPMSEAEFLDCAGEEVLRRVEFTNPQADSPKELVYVGGSSSGIEVWINRHYARADVKIAIGTIQPHGAVGYSGGAKLIFPGISGLKTIQTFHRSANTNPENYAGHLDSPIRKEIEDLVHMVGMDLLINLVVDPRGKISGLSAGHYVRSHRRAVPWAKNIYGVPVQRRSRILLVSSYPADLDFWQAAKGIFNCQSIVEDGGRLVLLTPCPDGIPREHAQFHRYIGTPSDKIEQMLENDESYDITTLSPALCLARFRERIHIGIVSPGLTREQVELMGFSYFSSVEEALSLAETDRAVTIDIVTHGGEMCPYLEKKE